MKVFKLFILMWLILSSLLGTKNLSIQISNPTGPVSVWICLKIKCIPSLLNQGTGPSILFVNNQLSWVAPPWSSEGKL